MIAQRQLADVLDDGRVGDVMEVTFRTNEGVTGSVRVPVDKYDVATVGAMIEARVHAIDAVHRIAGVVDSGD